MRCAGRLDYADFFHTHGDNAYPAAFLYLYTTLFACTGGDLKARSRKPPQAHSARHCWKPGAILNLNSILRTYRQVFQLVWALVEVLSLRAVGEMALQLRLPPIVAFLPVLSNRLHLYHTRVVTNDGINVAIMLSAVRLLYLGRPLAASALYSLALGSKLNFVTYGPAWAWAIFRTTPGGVRALLRAGCVLAVVQVGLALPFLLANARAFAVRAFNLGRDLVFDKTRVMRFVGRLCFATAAYKAACLLLAALLLVPLLLAHDARWRRARSPLARSRALVAGLLACNQVVVATAKALYTPFLAWSFYSLPALLALQGCSTPALVLLWGLFEGLFRPFSAPLADAWAQLVLWLVNFAVLHLCVAPQPVEGDFGIKGGKRAAPAAVDAIHEVEGSAEGHVRSPGVAKRVMARRRALDVVR
jgi:hypothetical protein